MMDRLVPKGGNWVIGFFELTLTDDQIWHIIIL